MKKLMLALVVFTVAYIGVVLFGCGAKEVKADVKPYMNFLGNESDLSYGSVKVYKDTANGNIVYITPEGVTAVPIHEVNTDK